jgi:carboxymethylenebutenolidase
VPPSTPPQVSPGDPDLVAGVAEFPGVGARLDGYLARPARSGTFPVVLVCHENRGLTRHIEDVARRLAKAGYVALAVDLLSREGGTDKHDFDAIPGILGKAPPARHVQDFRSGLAYARSQAAARGDRAGMVGFCFGGAVTWRVAAAVPELRAAVPFYGVPVPEADVPAIGAAVLAIYAGRDDRINQNIPAIESAMAKNGKTFRKIVYPGVDHAFHNDSGARYNADAAKAAWAETLAWFGKYLA